MAKKRSENSILNESLLEAKTFFEVVGKTELDFAFASMVNRLGRTYKGHRRVAMGTVNQIDNLSANNFIQRNFNINSGVVNNGGIFFGVRNLFYGVVSGEVTVIGLTGSLSYEVNMQTPNFVNGNLSGGAGRRLIRFEAGIGSIIVNQPVRFPASQNNANPFQTYAPDILLTGDEIGFSTSTGAASSGQAIFSMYADGYIINID